MSSIKDAMDSQKTLADHEARNTWRSLLIPAVGSAAFFASTLANIIKTYRKVGWPNGAFTKTDYLLMGIPFAIMALAFSEMVNPPLPEGSGEE
jgi:hypothetical protein